MTLADAIKPSEKSYPDILYDVLLIGFGFIFIAISAQIAARLPFTPVPISAQTLSVLLIGVLLGSKRGTLCVLLYLIAGFAGAPLFANGMGGPLYFFGPTGGYLIGFIPAVFLTGWLAEKGFDRTFFKNFLILLIGNLAIYIVGLLWLIPFAGFDKILHIGFYPFIIGDSIKIFLAIWLFPTIWKMLPHPKTNNV